MKKPFFFLLFFFSIFAVSVGQTNSLKQIIDEVGKNHVPDKRVTVYSLDVKESNTGAVLSGKISDKEIYTHLVDTLKKLSVNFTDSITLLPAPVVGEKCWTFVPLSVVTMFKSPDFSSEIISQALMGTPVKILDKSSDGWSQIQTPDGYIGWTETNLTGITLKERTQYNAMQKAVVTARSTLVYEKRYKNSAVVADVVLGDMLVVDGKSGTDEFTAVSLPDGRKGFISSCEIIPFERWKSTVRASGDNLVDLSKEFIGLPYFWGGLSPRGVDCSGLLKMVYFMHGIILPRDASQQYLCGIAVDTLQRYNKLQKGDLLFFGRWKKNETKPTVTHVGMYIGDMKFIHSSNMVHISSLDPKSGIYDRYNHKRLVGVKRVLGNTDGFEKIFDHDWYR